QRVGMLCRPVERQAVSKPGAGGGVHGTPRQRRLIVIAAGVSRRRRSTFVEVIDVQLPIIGAGVVQHTRLIHRPYEEILRGRGGIAARSHPQQRRGYEHRGRAGQRPVLDSIDQDSHGGPVVGGGDVVPRVDGQRGGRGGGEQASRI